MGALCISSGGATHKNEKNLMFYLKLKSDATRTTRHIKNSNPSSLKDKLFSTATVCTFVMI